MSSINTFAQVSTLDDEIVFMRWDHTITAITIGSSLAVVVFGGKSYRGDVMADTVVLEIGEFIIIKLRFIYSLNSHTLRSHMRVNALLVSFPSSHIMEEREWRGGKIF